MADSMLDAGDEKARQSPMLENFMNKKRVVFLIALYLNPTHLSMKE